MKIDYIKVDKLYKENLSDGKIAKEIGCSKRAITVWRNKNMLPPNMRKTIEIHNSWSKEIFIDLYNKGYVDIEIAKVLKVSEKTINAYRRKINLPSNQSHNIFISKDMEEIIVGTLLGDGNINCTSKSLIKKEKDTAILTFAHKIEQKDYCFHKYLLLKNLYNREPQYNVQERNGILNESYYAITKSSISLKKFRDIFYKGKEKIIPNNIELFYTKRSLAYHFMDDGSRKNNQYYLYLCSFSKESIQNLQKLLLSWGIETSLQKRNVLYIKSRSNKIFIESIKDFIVPSMQYKLPVSL